MKKNVGSTDKIIRLLIAAVIAILILTGILTNIVAIIFGIIGAAMIITSFISFCGLYSIFGWNTCAITEKK
jgi:hypothetical protein